MTQPSGGPVPHSTPASQPPATPLRRLVATAAAPRVFGWRSADIVRATALVLMVYYGLKLLWFASDLVLLAFLGVLFGLAVAAGVDHLRVLRLPRGVSAALIVLGFYAVLTGMGAVIGPSIATQGAELKTRLPEAIDRIEGWMHERRGVFSFLIGGPATPATPAASTPATAVRPRPSAPTGQPQGQPPAVTVDSTATAAATIRERLQGQLANAARYLFSFLSSTATVITGFLVLTTLAIYIGADPFTYKSALLALVPPSSRERFAEVMARIALVLKKWLVTQLIAMISIGVVSTIALLLLQVKAAFALGLIAALLEFVPTIGPILSAVPAIAMGFLDSPEKALWVALAYLVIQQAEGNILIPMLMQGGMDLPPAATILAQLLMALLFGFLGLMVAVPLLAALIVPIRMLYVEPMAAAALAGGADPP